MSNVASRVGFAEVNTLVLGQQPDVAPQLPVAKRGYSNEAEGTKTQATQEPRHTVVPFVVGNACAKKGARYPDEGERNQAHSNHHQAVVATQR